MTKQIIYRAFAGVLLGIAIGGCSSSNLHEITGNVTLDGKPVEQGTISFWPADGKGPSAQTILTAGKYKVLVAPGAKIVGVEAIKQVGEAHPSGPNGPAVPIHEVVSPPKYKDARTTDLKCEISSAGNHDFELKSG